MHTPTLPPFTMTPSITFTKPTSRIRASNIWKFQNGRSFSCKSSNSSYSSVTDLNLYDLLGVDSSSDQEQIKLAYRVLQKRCHPDIAGPSGHDMAIILNEAYALLSDPNSRVAYDKEQAKFADFQGYTGQPIYSAWLGSETENRAVFVDELRCIGCLKCALLAEKTFAIESVYGRARVIAQWADPEKKIQQAIDSCPVDCISITKKSDLAALEFLMSKKPRGNVRIGTGNTVGVRTSDVFQDLEKFKARYQDVVKKGSAGHSEISDAGQAAKISAIQAIRAISNWLYWQSPISGSTGQGPKKLMLISENSTEPDIQRLRNAAAARKQANQRAQPTERVTSSNSSNDEYWVPSTLVLPETAVKSGSDGKVRATKPAELKELDNAELLGKENRQSNRFSWVMPMTTATVAATIVRLQVVKEASGDIKDHVGGSMALEIVNSSWLQVILAGVTWYLIGMAVMELVEAFRDKVRKLGK